ncbi:hypothetical protein GCM10010121_098040 [Streptomyces brasiliensis]|uniref:Uncharacterized protein n=2 Tax=Streptomyces brasiliensis TaxID=1954 RepID=A0A917PDD0_9ACTN|nr:hypothetical protein GCM10010121_098040 [Streptomyces brasiliensis]
MDRENGWALIRTTSSVMDEQADAVWERELDDLSLCISHRFGRADLRRRMRDYVRGLLAPAGRKNGWTIAVRHEVA